MVVHSSAELNCLKAVHAVMGMLEIEADPE